MSCFKGRMSEYRNVSLDRFDGPNLQSTAYFLSHLHEDHTVGLSLPSFISRLKGSSDVYLYCSDVTKVLLIETPKYQHLERYIKTLPVNQPVTISIPQTSSCKVDFVQVTLLPAAHCPGSVMFLFEGSEGTVLYTGDFRWDANHVSKVAALHTGERVKSIQSLYVDTTFCHPDCFHIPSRQNCVEAVTGMVKEWIAKGQSHVVHFTPRSTYGHEHLLKEISTRMCQKIHVSKAKVKIYEQIADLQGIFTSDPDETPIHACLWEKFAKRDQNSLPCDYQPPKHSKLKKMVILPSTMYFTKKMRLNLVNIVDRTQGIYRVCYSFHSSYSEVRSLVTYLKPSRVRPNVKPEPDSTLNQVQERLNHFLKLDHIEHKHEAVSKVFGTLKTRKKKRKYTRYTHKCSSDSDDLVFGSPDLKRIRSNEQGNVTPVKNQAARDRGRVPPISPQEAVTPMKSEISDAHSSYVGSNHDDSEMSETGLLCDSSDDQEEVSGLHGDTLSTPPQSLLEAIDSQSSSQEVKSFRVTFLEDQEQTVGQQAWESPDVPDFGEEESNSKIQNMETDQNDLDKSDTVGGKSSHSKDISTEAASDESLKCQDGYQGDVDSSQEQNASQKYSGKETCNTESGVNSERGNVVSEGGKDLEGPNSLSQSVMYEDKLLEEDNTDCDDSVNLDLNAEHSPQCSRNKTTNKSNNCTVSSDMTSQTVTEQSKRVTSNGKSREWKRNSSYDLFEDSNDGFNEGDMERDECQIVPVNGVQTKKGNDMEVKKQSKKCYDSKCNKNDVLLMDKHQTKISIEIREDSEKQDLSENSEGFQVTDLTQNYDEKCCGKDTRDIQTVPSVSHVCQAGDIRSHVNKNNVHRLSSCDTPGTSRSLCQCVLDTSPQPDTILVEIQEDIETESKQNRQHYRRSPQKPSSKLLTNTQTNDLVIAILDSDSESDDQESNPNKADVASVHGNDTDSDITLPPSQEICKVTDVCDSSVKDDDVMIIDDDDTDDESDSSSSSSSSNESSKRLSARSRLDKIQHALQERNKKRLTTDITMYLVDNNTLGSNKLSDDSDKHSDDSDKHSDDSDKHSDDNDCCVIDLTQSDSESD